MSVQATVAATLVDEWVRCGVRHAVICPGSRSTPLVAALAALAAPSAGPVRIHVRLDERSGAYLAVGIAKATGRPALVVTTSGTAALELHPALGEAHHARVPVIAVTADRPGDLKARGAPQTTRQSGIFPGIVRAHWDLDAAGGTGAAAGSAWRAIAARSVTASLAGSSGPGPVHVNIAFAEPLVGEPGEPEPGRPGGEPWEEAPHEDGEPPGDLVDYLLARRSRRGLIVAGAPGSAPVCGSLHARAADSSPDGAATTAARYAQSVMDISRALGWPVLGDPLSGTRGYPEHSVVAAAELLVRSRWSSSLEPPETILRIGAPWASRALNSWIDASGGEHIALDRFGRFVDPGGVVARRVRCDAEILARRIDDRASGSASTARTAAGRTPAWTSAWEAAEACAQGAIDASLRGLPLSEPWIARRMWETSPASTTIVVSSSLPVRTLETFARPRSRAPAVYANRGVNGIDGVVSTAAGVTLGCEGAPCEVLVGDLAFLHDATALMSLDADVNLTVVVIDNGGGGIFAFLDQAGAFGSEDFDRFFSTPQDTDVADLARAHGVRVAEAEDGAAFDEALARARATRGIDVVVCRIEPGSTTRVHQVVGETVGKALEASLRR